MQKLKFFRKQSHGKADEKWHYVAEPDGLAQVGFGSHCEPIAITNYINKESTMMILNYDIPLSNNPNWPSKTGNASGKGRGNNPPKGK